MLSIKKRLLILSVIIPGVGCGQNVAGGAAGAGNAGGESGEPGGGVSGSGGDNGGGGGAPGPRSLIGPGVAPAGDGTCDSPYEIPMDLSHAEIEVSTTERNHHFALPCAPSGNDVVLSFVLTQREVVYADTFGASWNTVLYFGNSCDVSTAPPAGAETVACNDDSCGTNQSQVATVLGYGRHYLLVGGARSESGTVTVHFQHALAGNGPLTFLSPGSGTLEGTTSGIGFVSRCEAAAPENSYWWRSCPAYAGGSFSATTCHGTEFDTILSLQIPRAETMSCSDDDPSCSVQSTLTTWLPAGAGIHVLTVDGNAGSNSGAYRLTYKRP